MKTIFDKASRDELISRINSLNENSTAQWGEMNVSQMLKHCSQWMKWRWEERNINNHLLENCLVKLH